MGSKKRRVLVIGLDGATFDYLLPMMDKGITPFLKKLTEKGSAVPLLSTIPPVTAPAWASFATGQNPGKHGIISFLTEDKEKRQYKDDAVLWDKEKDEVASKAIVDTKLLHGISIWDVLSKNKKRSILINVPLTYPPRRINGLMITGMLTPSKKVNWTYPKSLAKKISKDYVIELLDYFWGGKEYRLEELLDDISQMSKTRAKVALKLMKQSWDFFMIVLVGPDRIAHIAWPYLNLNRKVKAKKEIKIREKIINYFKNLDGYIKNLVQASKEAMVFIISDHGFGDFPVRVIHLKAIKNFEKELEVVNLHHQNYVGLNLKNKSWDEEELYEFLDSGGMPDIYKLYSKGEIFWGERTSGLPDFILQSENKYLLRNNKGNGNVEEFLNERSNIHGTHRLEGIFISSEPSLQRSLNLDLPRLIDLAPTIYSVLDIPSPSQTDGKDLFGAVKKQGIFSYQDWLKQKIRILSSHGFDTQPKKIKKIEEERRKKEFLKILAKNKQLKKETKRLLRQLRERDVMLNKIYHSKTWRLLWIYKQIVGFPKKSFSFFRTVIKSKTRLLEIIHL